MRGFKEFFRMIVTAVICFGTKMFGGNKKRICKSMYRKWKYFLSDRNEWELEPFCK